MCVYLTAERAAAQEVAAFVVQRAGPRARLVAARDAVRYRPARLQLLVAATLPVARRSVLGRQDADHGSDRCPDSPPGFHARHAGGGAIVRRCAPGLPALAIRGLTRLAPAGAVRGDAPVPRLVEPSASGT